MSASPASSFFLESAEHALSAFFYNKCLLSDTSFKSFRFHIYAHGKDFWPWTNTTRCGFVAKAGERAWNGTSMVSTPNISDREGSPSQEHLQVRVSFSEDILSGFAKTFGFYRRTADRVEWATYPHPHAQHTPAVRALWHTYEFPQFSAPAVKTLNGHLAESAYFAGLQNVTLYASSGKEIELSLSESLEDKTAHGAAYRHELRALDILADAMATEEQKERLYRRIVNDTLRSPEFISLSVGGHLLRLLSRELALPADQQAIVDGEIAQAGKYLRDPTRHIKRIFAEERPAAVYYNPWGEQRVDSEWRPRVGDNDEIVIKRFVDGDYVNARVITIDQEPYEVHVSTGWGAVPDAMVELHKGLQMVKGDRGKVYGRSGKSDESVPISVWVPEETRSEA